MSIVYLFVSVLLLYQSVIKIDVPNKWASACVQLDFEQCSKEKLNMHLHLSSNSVQDVDGLVARARLVTSELMKLLGRRLRMQLIKTIKNIS